VKISFERGIRGIEQLAAGNHDDVNAPRCQGFRAPENLSNQALGTVSPDGISELPRGDDAESYPPRRVRRREDGQKASGCPTGSVEYPLKLAATSKPPVGREALGQHRAGRAAAQDEETVSRLRPLARRRFNTSRPFFVAILTRKPCVRRRRRRFGWNVTLMISNPCSGRRKSGETSIVASHSRSCQTTPPPLDHCPHTPRVLQSVPHDRSKPRP
jgi:hypothetical protein